MKPIHTFLITPKKERYDNIKKINDTELILNSGITDHKFVSREAVIHETPIINGKHFTRGTELYVHHNIFRRWHDVRGIEKNSKSYFKDNLYFCELDQIFLYKHEGGWKANQGYCFIKPLASEDEFSTNKEKPLMGIVKYTDGTVNEGDLIGFRPSSEYEFIIDGKKLYRLLSKFITIKYEYQGDEEEYNPSWAKGS